MPQPLLRTVFMFCFVLSAFACKAQYYDWLYFLNGHEIATDYNTCMQGVKDSSGKWIVEPKYENLVPCYATYITMQGGRYGVIDTIGRELIPPVYDYIQNVSQIEGYEGSLFVFLQNGKRGVINRENKIVIPCQYIWINASHDSTFVATIDRWHWDFYSVDGVKSTPPWKAQSPDRIASHTYAVRKRSIFRKRRDYGVINDKGQVILEREYDHVRGFYSTNTLYVRKGNKYGFCSAAGKMIWPMVFTVPYDYDWYMGNINIVAETGVGPAYYNGKWGLISIKGDTVLPFIYSHISQFDEEDAEAKQWLVDVDTLQGVYDIEHGWIVPPECSYISPLSTFYSRTDSSRVGLLLCAKAEKWGVITTAGQVIVPFKADQVLQDEGKVTLLIGDSVFVLRTFSYAEFGKMSHIIAPEENKDTRNADPDIGYSGGPAFTSAPGSKQFSVFNGRNGTLAWYDPESDRDSIYSYNNGKKFSCNTGNYYHLNVPDSVIAKCAFYLMPVGAPLYTGKDGSFRLYSNPYLVYDTADARYASIAVIHSAQGTRLNTIRTWISGPYHSTYFITTASDVLKGNGEVILSGDSISSITPEYHGHSGELYFASSRWRRDWIAYDSTGRIIMKNTTRVGDFTDRYKWSEKEGAYESWELVDRRTGKNVLGKKTYSDIAYPIWDSMTIVRNKKTGCRLFNCDRYMYLTKYGFNDIIPINPSGSLFCVLTCSGNMGVMNAAGQFVLDTIYESFTPAGIDTSWTGSGALPYAEWHNTFYRHLVFYNGKDVVIFDPARGQIVNKEQRTSILWPQCVRYLRTNDLLETVSDTIFPFFAEGNKVQLYVPLSDSGHFAQWQMNVLTDSLYSPARTIRGIRRFRHHGYSGISCAYCVNKGSAYRPFRWVKNYNIPGRFILQHRSDSALSFCRFEKSIYDWDTDDVERVWCSNALLFPDGAHNVTLDSLFDPKTDWRNFIINTVISYVNSHQDIEGDCHNPAGIPVMLNDAFLISEEGLLLFPKEFTENGDQLVLTVPWNECSPYLRSDMRTKLPMNGK